MQLLTSVKVIFPFTSKAVVGAVVPIPTLWLTLSTNKAFELNVWLNAPNVFEASVFANVLLYAVAQERVLLVAYNQPVVKLE